MKKYLFILLSSLVFSSVAYADSPVSVDSGSMPKYNYFFNNESLKSVLIKIGQSNGTQVVFKDISGDKLATQVRGRFNVTDTTTLLNTLAKQYGFNWFNYSGTMYVTNMSQISKTFAISSDDIPMISNNLEQLGLLNSKFGYSELNSENKVVITGPKAYLDIVSGQIRQLNVAPRNQQFAVFRLQYANAQDLQVTYNNRQIVIPGVATILQKILGGGDGKTPLMNNVLDGKSTQGLFGANANESGANATPTAEVVNGSPIVQADERLNTIIIRDKPSNLAMYRNLIKELDKPAPLIQIEVLIVRLDNNNLDQSGINWWLGGNNGMQGGFNKLGSTGGINSMAMAYSQINPGQLMIGSITSFNYNLQFLETKNLASVTAKPSLVTTDNLPAIVNSNQNLNISNNGTGENTADNQNNSMTSVSLVQSLEITPHVIYNKNKTRYIKLSINLLDGSVDRSNDEVTPGFVQNSLNSQAVIPEGKSLILAGYTKDKTLEVTHKVPFLGDIPLLGWFFKSSYQEAHKFTTMYIVTPKIITFDGVTPLSKYVPVDGSSVYSHDYDNLKVIN